MQSANGSSVRQTLDKPHDSPPSTPKAVSSLKNHPKTVAKQVIALSPRFSYIFKMNLYSNIRGARNPSKDLNTSARAGPGPSIPSGTSVTTLPPKAGTSMTTLR